MVEQVFDFAPSTVDVNVHQFKASFRLVTRKSRAHEETQPKEARQRRSAGLLLHSGWLESTIKVCVGASKNLQHSSKYRTKKKGSTFILHPPVHQKFRTKIQRSTFIPLFTKKFGLKYKDPPSFPCPPKILD